MIRVLPTEVVDRIAAGEVVERPASVVKELVENALDAGGSEVMVEFAGGGVERIEVADDGAGMEPGEARLAFERHATSKIGTEHDLLEVATFGFRGEALPSIASVSRVTLLTRARAAPAGARLRLEAGRLVEHSPAGVPEGTRVRVEDLFFNTPARLKFLKTERTETSRLLEVVRHLALTHPEVAFSVMREGAEVFSCPRSGSEGERVRQVFSRLDLHAFHESVGAIDVRGYLTAPASSRAGTSGLVLILNGRPVVDRSLAGALAAAHEGLLPPGRYPQGLLVLEVPRRGVDVNVHPQKREMRLSEPRVVTGAIYRAVSAWAKRAPWMGGASSSRVAEPADVVPYGAPPAPGRPAGREGVIRSPVEPLLDLAPVGSPAASFASLEVVGQVLGTYIVCGGSERVVFVDQHAAAERVVFEDLRREYRDGSVARQLLLVPVRSEVGEARAALVEENEGLLEAFGLAVDLTGPGTVAVREIPVLVSGADPARLLDDALDELEDARGRLDQVAERVLSTMACHSSVRGGDALDHERARALLRDLDRVDWAHHCPHGRPVSFEITRAEIERRLGRS
jgi:DNA mismatch repair protein MutL